MLADKDHARRRSGVNLPSGLLFINSLGVPFGGPLNRAHHHLNPVVFLQLVWHSRAKTWDSSSSMPEVSTLASRNSRTSASVSSARSARLTTTSAVPFRTASRGARAVRNFMRLCYGCFRWKCSGRYTTSYSLDKKDKRMANAADLEIRPPSTRLIIRWWQILSRSTCAFSWLRRETSRAGRPRSQDEVQMSPPGMTTERRRAIRWPSRNRSTSSISGCLGSGPDRLRGRSLPTAEKLPGSIGLLSPMPALLPPSDPEQPPGPVFLVGANASAWPLTG